MNIKERQPPDENEDTLNTNSVTNSMHLRDESEARQQLLERFGEEGNIIDFETSDHYEFAKSFKEEFRSRIK